LWYFAIKFRHTHDSHTSRISRRRQCEHAIDQSSHECDGLHNQRVHVQVSSARHPAFRGNGPYAAVPAWLLRARVAGQQSGALSIGRLPGSSVIRRTPLFYDDDEARLKNAAPFRARPGQLNTLAQIYCTKFRDKTSDAASHTVSSHDGNIGGRSAYYCRKELRRLKQCVMTTVATLIRHTNKKAKIKSNTFCSTSPYYLRAPQITSSMNTVRNMLPWSLSGTSISYNWVEILAIERHLG